MLKRLFQWITSFFRSESADKGLSDFSKPGDSRPLVEFAKRYGKMQINIVKEPSGRCLLDRCAFIDKKGRCTFVNIAKNLRNWSKEDIERRKDELSVVVLGSGKYCLCLEWKDVEL